MIRVRQFFKELKRERGVAILMILTAVTILTALLADFTFDTKINRFKVQNMQDRVQAQLNAEAGLKLAMARLKLYKEAFNLLEKNKDAKKVVKGDMLNQIWSVPFMYPIPESKNMNIIQRNALADFTKKSLLQGELKLVIQNASNLINLNLLRISPYLKKKTTPTTTDEGSKVDDEGGGAPDEYSVESQLVKLLSDEFEKKKESDEEWNDTYGEKDPRQLISAIKHFVSDKDSYEDEFRAELDNAYEARGVTPKHAPLSSMSEILMIEGWDERILELIENEVTVHGVVLIDLNKITKKMLKLIIPEMEEEQLKAFFKYRDDPKDPKTFNSLNDFRAYIVTKAQILSESTFDERMKKYEKAGIKFGVSGSLFRVIATGSFGRADYTITAYVSIPAKPVKEEKKKKTDPKRPNPPGSDPSTQPAPEATPAPEEGDGKKERPIELLEPRLVEMQVS